MERSFQDILFLHEREDNAAARSECELLNAVRGEFANADRLISKAREKGFSLSAFFSGEPLPADLPLPVRRSEVFYVKKHTSAQQPYLHAHEFYELLYVQSGTCMQTLRNGRGVSLQKGQCCLIRPGEAHRIGRVGKVDVILKAVIPSDLILRAADRIPLPEGGLVVFGRPSLFAEYLFLRLLRESLFAGFAMRLRSVRFYPFSFASLHGERGRKVRALSRFTASILRTNSNLPRSLILPDRSAIPPLMRAGS